MLCRRKYEIVGDSKENEIAKTCKHCPGREPHIPDLETYSCGCRPLILENPK
jgi:hypothetical protein